MSNKPNDGYYTLVYGDSSYRTLRFRTTKKGPYRGSVVLSFKEMGEYVGCANVKPDGSVYFWRNFAAQNSQERLARIRYAVRKIIEAPNQHQAAFAMKEGRCARCGRKLTVPASIANFMGPECAGRKTGWRKSDQQAAFSVMQAAATPKTEAHV